MQKTLFWPDYKIRGLVECPDCKSVWNKFEAERFYIYCPNCGKQRKPLKKDKED